MAECYNMACPYCVDYSCKRTATCDMRLDGVYVKVKHGRWIEDEYGIPHCSECKAINNTVYKNYCPNCGADMREVEK